MKLKDSFIIIFLILISSLLIFYKFNQIPKNLSFDEVDFAHLALSLNGKSYIPYSTLATGHSTLYFYILLLSFKLFGITNFALRLPSALFGILGVVMFYQVMKEAFKKYYGWLPFVLSIIFITTRWFFNFARFSFEATLLLFLELASTYFIFRILNIKEEKGKINNWELFFSGVFAALAFNSYTPGRIFFLLPIGFLIIRKFSVKQILLFIIPFLILIAPLGTYLTTHKDNRVDQEFFLKNTELSVNKKVEFLWSNISSTALMFNFKGDVNGRHNYPLKPALNQITGSLFLMGLLICIYNIKKTRNQFFIGYFLLGLVPAILTYPWENPNMLRTFTVIPSVVYFIGMSLYFLIKIVFLFNHVRDKIFIKTLVVTVLIIIICFSSLYEIRTYFVYQQTVFKQAFDIRESLPKAIKKLSVL